MPELLLGQPERGAPEAQALADDLLDRIGGRDRDPYLPAGARWRSGARLAMFAAVDGNHDLLAGSGCGKHARPTRGDRLLSKVKPMFSWPFPRANLLRARHLVLVVLAAAGLLAGCASKDADAPVPDRPAEELYNEAQNFMAQGNYRDAAKSFEEVERQHPYSQWATRGQIMAAYAYYQANQYDEAVAAAERFIELHPGHKDVAYAYYLDGHQLLRADQRRRPRPGDDQQGAGIVQRIDPPLSPTATTAAMPSSRST